MDEWKPMEGLHRIHVSGRPIMLETRQRYIVEINDSAFPVQGVVFCLLTRLAIAWPDGVNKYDLDQCDNCARYTYRLREQTGIAIANDHRGNYRLVADNVTIDVAAVRQFPDITIQRLMDEYEKRNSPAAV